MDSIVAAIQRIMVERLELPVDPSDLQLDAPLFGPPSVGGHGLDSLDSLDILAGLSEHFDLLLEDIDAGDFRSIRTLSEYVRQKTATTI